MKPSVHSIGAVNSRRPRYIVNSQLKIFTPVGIAMIIVAMPKNALTSAPEPIVKKWCSHTRKDRTMMRAGGVDHRLVTEQRLLREKVATTSENTPNAGRTRMYTSG